MRNFDQQLLRLKAALSLTADQDVAAALGMTKAAFSDRKRRDVFPSDKLRELAVARPELRLDVVKILTGESADFTGRLGALREATRMSGGDMDRRDAIARTLLDQQPTQSEAGLLADYRRCTPDDQLVIRRMAATLAAATHVMRAAEPETAYEVSPSPPRSTEK